MKKIIACILISTLILSCSSDDTRSDNLNLPSVPVNFTINLNLPEFDGLNFSGQSHVITTDGVGIRGIIVYNINDTLYSAFELSDPNIPPSDCSALNVSGITAESNCGNDNVYNIITGQQLEGEGGFPLLRYNIVRNGNTLSITN